MGKSRKPRSASETTPPDGDASVDAVLGELEQVVAELERGDLPLEDALTRFERGVGLARTGERMLSSVERRVEMLLAERDDVVPFESSADAGGSDSRDGEE